MSQFAALPSASVLAADAECRRRWLDEPLYSPPTDLDRSPLRAQATSESQRMIACRCPQCKDRRLRETHGERIGSIVSPIQRPKRQAPQRAFQSYLPYVVRRQQNQIEFASLVVRLLDQHAPHEIQQLVSSLIASMLCEEGGCYESVANRIFIFMRCPAENLQKLGKMARYLRVNASPLPPNVADGLARVGGLEGLGGLGASEASEDEEPQEEEPQEEQEGPQEEAAASAACQAAWFHRVSDMGVGRVGPVPKKPEKGAEMVQCGGCGVDFNNASFCRACAAAGYAPARNMGEALRCRGARDSGSHSDYASDSSESSSHWGTESNPGPARLACPAHQANLEARAAARAAAQADPEHPLRSGCSETPQAHGASAVILHGGHVSHSEGFNTWARMTPEEADKWLMEDAHEDRADSADSAEPAERSAEPTEPPTKKLRRISSQLCICISRLA